MQKHDQSILQKTQYSGSLISLFFTCAGGSRATVRLQEEDLWLAATHVPATNRALLTVSLSPLLLPISSVALLNGSCLPARLVAKCTARATRTSGRGVAALRFLAMPHPVETAEDAAPKSIQAMASVVPRPMISHLRSGVWIRWWWWRSGDLGEGSVVSGNLPPPQTKRRRGTLGGGTPARRFPEVVEGEV